MHWLNYFLQVTATFNGTIDPQSNIWKRLSAIAPLFSVLTAIANLLLAIYIFGYTRRKNNSDIKIKWFLELVYTPNKEAFANFFANLLMLNKRIPADGNLTDQQKIDAMDFIKTEAGRFQRDFVNVLEIVAPAIHTKVNNTVEQLTDRLVGVLDNDELRLENTKTFAREIGSPIMRAKGAIISAIFEYKG